MSAREMAALPTGSKLPDGSVIERFLEGNEAMAHYAAVHPELGAVRAHWVAPEALRTVAALDDALKTLSSVVHRSVERHLGRGTLQGTPYFLTAAIVGTPLPKWLAQQAGEDGLSQEYALRLLTHIVRSLEVLHVAGPHAAIRLEDILLCAGGEVVLTGAGYRRVELAASVQSQAFLSRASIAPEVRDDVWQATESADYWSLGIVLLTLLRGAEPAPEEVPSALNEVAARVSAQTLALLEALLDEEPGLRMSSPGEVRANVEAALKRIAEEKGPEPEKDPFEGLDLPPVPQDQGPDELPIWIVRRDGRDWGPFSQRDVLAQLHRDEIDEHTVVVDMRNRDARTLLESLTFKAAVKAYLPVRAEKEVQRIEKREHTVAAVKRTSSTAMIATGLGIALLSYIGYVNASATAPLQMENFPGSWGFVVAMANTEYTGISADDALLAALFDYSDPAAEAQNPDRPARPGRAAQPDDNYEEDEILADDYVVDFDNTAPTSLLTSDQINATVRENLYRIRDCYAAETAANPGFRGVVASWSIRPDGRVYNARLTEDSVASRTLEQCVLRAIRRMQFPQFNNTPMNISFPLRVQ